MSDEYTNEDRDVAATNFLNLVKAVFRKEPSLDGVGYVVLTLRQEGGEFGYSLYGSNLPVDLALMTLVAHADSLREDPDHSAH